MEDYLIFRQRNPPEAAILPFFQQGFFFNNAEHLCQQSRQPLCVISVLNRTTQRAVARCAFFVKDNRAISPAGAPFGSLEFSQTLPDTVLGRLIDALIDEAQSLSVSTLRLVNYPNCYAPEEARRLTAQLLQREFRVAASDQNFFLPVTDDSFETFIHASERRRLRKCRQAGFQWQHWCCPDLDAVMSFLVQTHQQRGYKLTLPPNRLRSLIQTFPNQFLIFTVRDNVTIAALTVAIRVRTDILYNFLPASNPIYDIYSPMVFLTEGVFSYCQQHQIQLLDLGVSLDGNHQPKPSLMRFKRNLGAHESPKIVFEKSL
ncbi:MAG: family N-acetyltransferase [Spirosoma sp.]|nr:family N-acetyltransferase [Spirosoma sp.]